MDEKILTMSYILHSNSLISRYLQNHLKYQKIEWDPVTTHYLTFLNTKKLQTGRSGSILKFEFFFTNGPDQNENPL